MNKIYLSFPSGDFGEYEVDELNLMFEQGLIQLDCYYWRIGMVDWRPISELYSPEYVSPTDMDRKIYQTKPESPFISSKQQKGSSQSYQFSGNQYLIMISILISIILIFIFLKKDIAIFNFKQQMVLIDPEPFLMGSPIEEVGRKNGEIQHMVILTHKYWISKYEVTQKLWENIMGFEKNFSVVKGENLPVNNVSWALANEFCQKLTKHERRLRRIPKGYEYRLPTEAQWEYACRAGTKTAYNNGQNMKIDGNTEELKKIAWFRDNSMMTPNEVGTKLPNAFGLYDMHGNVREWCLDGVYTYSCIPVVNPLIKNKRMGYRVRGGGCCDVAAYCRSGVRLHELSGGEKGERTLIGLRIALVSKNSFEITIQDTCPNLDLVEIKAGEYVKGSAENEIGRKPNETQSIEKIETPFKIGKYEITQLQWEYVKMPNKSLFKESQFPIHNISWGDAMEFCKRITDILRREHKLSWSEKITLPTEAQWEYVCRAGTTQAFNNGENLTSLKQNPENLTNLGWMIFNSLRSAHPVGKKQPNAWGIYDMHGNVWEFCSDRYEDKKTEKQSEDIDLYIIKGGSWGSEAKDCRSASREDCFVNFIRGDVGLRVISISVDPIKEIAETLYIEPENEF